MFPQAIHGTPVVLNRRHAYAAPPPPDACLLGPFLRAQLHTYPTGGRQPMMSLTAGDTVALILRVLQKRALARNALESVK